jgi:hypothetical protein
MQRSLNVEVSMQQVGYAGNRNVQCSIRRGCLRIVGVAPCLRNTVVTRAPQIFLMAVRIHGLSSIST